MKHEGFTPIGQTARTVPRESPSADGNNAGKAGSGALQVDTARVAAWLAQQVPGDMTQAAELRARSHGVGLRVRYEGRYPEGGGFYEVAVGCDVDGYPSQRKAALADLRNFMTQAPIRAVEAWLAELSVLVAKRQDSDMAEELRVEAFASRLSRYPADVARAATIGRKPMWQFWPTWAELEAECEKLVSPRRAMIAALERPVVQEPERRPATAEEKARVAELVAQMFPGVSRETRERAVNEAMAGDCMMDGGNDHNR